MNLLAGKIEEGLDNWSTVLASGDASSSRELGALLIERESQLIEMMGKRSRPKPILGGRSLSSLAENERLDASARLVCIRCLDALGLSDDAARALRTLEPFGAFSNPDHHGFVRRFWTSEIRRQQGHGDYARALEAIEQLQRLDPRAGHSLRALWVMARIGDLHESHALLDALTVVLDELHPLLPEIATHRLDGLLRELPGWACGATAPPERFAAAREFLETRLGKVFPIEAGMALDALLVSQADRLLGEGNTTATLALLGNSDEIQASEALRNRVIEAEYRNRLASLSDDDLMGRYRLGEWALEHNRPRWSLALFHECARDEALRPLAEGRIQLLATQLDGEALQQAMSRFQQGRYFDALDALDSLLKRDPQLPPSTLYEEARRMADLIRNRLEVESHKRPYRAEVLYQQAERSFFSGNDAAAIQSLAEVLRDYGETPAARRAEALLPRVMRALEVAHLEGRGKRLIALPPEVLERARRDTTRLDEEIRGLLNVLDSPSSDSKSSPARQETRH
jgi:tetratricopeptide (TPR) repeat protein